MGETTGESTEVPSLTYNHWSRRDLDPAVVGDHPLARVHQTQAWVHDGDLVVYVRGGMRRRDGGVGPNRACCVDLTAAQPEWLAAIIADARERLSLLNREATDGEG